MARRHGGGGGGGVARRLALERVAFSTRRARRVRRARGLLARPVTSRTLRERWQTSTVGRRPPRRSTSSASAAARPLVPVSRALVPDWRTDNCGGRSVPSCGAQITSGLSASPSKSRASSGEKGTRRSAAAPAAPPRSSRKGGGGGASGAARPAGVRTSRRAIATTARPCAAGDAVTHRRCYRARTRDVPKRSRIRNEVSDRRTRSTSKPVAQLRSSMDVGASHEDALSALIAAATPADGSAPPPPNSAAGAAARSSAHRAGPASNSPARAPAAPSPKPSPRETVATWPVVRPPAAARASAGDRQPADHRASVPAATTRSGAP